jgi:hypothetical protein
MIADSGSRTALSAAYGAETAIMGGGGSSGGGGSGGSSGGGGIASVTRAGSRPGRTKSRNSNPLVSYK